MTGQQMTLTSLGSEENDGHSHFPERSGPA